MRSKKVKKKFCKVLEICIKCKTMELKKTGEGRKFKLCPRCYITNKTHKTRALKPDRENGVVVNVTKPYVKFKDAKNPSLNRNARYWKQNRRIRLKTKFRYQAFQVYGQRCMCCGASSEVKSLELDHILPQSLYPEKEFEFNNTQILCGDCNLGKLNKDFTDFRNEKQKERMIIHSKSIGSNEDINLVKRLQQNIKEYRKLSFMEQVTGIKLPTG